jgi:hypothetical protein
MTTKFCVNCHHVGIVLRSRQSPLHKCTRTPLAVSPVTGEPDGEYPTCQSERDDATLCGPEGKYFIDAKEVERVQAENFKRRAQGQMELPFPGIGGTDGNGKPK